jgi:hypothetical protein
MAQATNVSTISPARFHNDADPALANSIDHAALKGAAVTNHSTDLPIERVTLPSSRRSFLHTMAALPIAAAAPVATAHALDADLIELGARFEPLVDQYYVTRKRWARSMVAAHAEYDREEHDQYSPEAFDSSCRRCGVDETQDALAAINQEMEELANAINAASVNSIPGLRAKALVAFWKVAPIGAGNTEFSFEHPSPFQHLFMAVAELCGLKDKMAATGYQLPDITMVDDDDFRWSEPA